MKKTIIFRADGNSATGLGHLYRLFSLVEIIKESFNYKFITSSSSTTAIIPSGYNTHSIPLEIGLNEEPQWLYENYPPNNHVIVADGYQFNSEYQKKIKKFGFNFMYIDDLANEHIYADIVINHSPYLKEEDYNKETYTECLLGTTYAMLRPAFLKAAKQSRIIDNINTAFVCFGGADPMDLSFKTSKTLLDIPQLKKIHVVLGGAYKHTSIFDLQKENHHKIELHKNLSEFELVGIMQDSHLGIAPSSTIMYELCCVKMPIYCGYYVENQKYVYQGFLDAEAILPAGDLSQFDEIECKENIENIINKGNTDQLIISQKKLFDDKIESRFLTVFDKLTLILPEVRLREAVKNDLLLFFNWANDKVTRQMSFHKDPISLKTHTQWFNNQLNSEDNILLVLEAQEQGVFKPAGQVKFDSEGIIGIALDEEFRGKKLGATLIEEGLKYAKEYSKHKQITAYIKKANKGSIKVFEKAGFSFSEEVLVNEEECYKYICNL